MIDSPHALPSTANVLLAALPAPERDALLRGARRAPLMAGDIVYEQDQRLDGAYFPLAGAVSMLSVLEDGNTIETAIVGREGALGFPLGLGVEPSPWRSVVQIAGEAIVVDRAVMRAQLVRPGGLAPLLTHYAGALMAMLSQSGACAHFHSVRQRCARWLLLMHDRASADMVPVTQQFLSDMLGSRRPSVTEAVQELRAQGCIDYTRGVIRIVDRDALESASCECYERIRRRSVITFDAIRGAAAESDVADRLGRAADAD